MIMLMIFAFVTDTICSIFGHILKLNSNENEIWLSCKVCGNQFDVPEERKEEAYQKLSVYKGDLSWKK